MEERYQTEDCIVICPQCQASSAGELEATLTALAACENCSQDIAEDGEHTGFGDAILSGLSRRFGATVVWEAWRRLAPTQG